MRDSNGYLTHDDPCTRSPAGGTELRGDRRQVPVDDLRTADPSQHIPLLLQVEPGTNVTRGIPAETALDLVVTCRAPVGRQQIKQGPLILAGHELVSSHTVNLLAQFRGGGHRSYAGRVASSSRVPVRRPYPRGALILRYATAAVLLGSGIAVLIKAIVTSEGFSSRWIAAACLLVPSGSRALSFSNVVAFAFLALDQGKRLIRMRASAREQGHGDPVPGLLEFLARRLRELPPRPAVATASG